MPLTSLPMGPQGYEPISGWPLQPSPVPGQTIIIPPSHGPNGIVPASFMTMGSMPMQGNYVSWPTGMPNGQMGYPPPQYWTAGLDERGRSMYRGMPAPRSASSAASTASSILTSSSESATDRKKGKKPKPRSRSRSREARKEKKSTKKKEISQRRKCSKEGHRSRQGRKDQTSPARYPKGKDWRPSKKDDGWKASSDSSSDDDSYAPSRQKAKTRTGSSHTGMRYREILRDTLDNHGSYTAPTKPLVSAMKGSSRFRTSPEPRDPRTPRVAPFDTFTPPTTTVKQYTEESAEPPKTRRQNSAEAPSSKSCKRPHVGQPSEKRASMPSSGRSSASQPSYVPLPKTPRIETLQSPATTMLGDGLWGRQSGVYPIHGRQSSQAAAKEFSQLGSKLERQAEKRSQSSSPEARPSSPLDQSSFFPSSPIVRPPCPAPTGERSHSKAFPENPSLCPDDLPPNLSRRSTHTGVTSVQARAGIPAPTLRRGSAFSDEVAPPGIVRMAGSAGRDAGLDHKARIPVSTLLAKEQIITLTKPEHMTQEEWEKGDEEPPRAPWYRMEDSVIEIVFPGTSFFISESVLMQDSPNVLSSAWQMEKHRLKRGQLLKIPINNRSPLMFSLIYGHMAGEETIPLSISQVLLLRTLDTSAEGKDPYELLYEEALFYHLAGLQNDIYDCVTKVQDFCDESDRPTDAIVALSSSSSQLRASALPHGPAPLVPTAPLSNQRGPSGTLSNKHLPMVVPPVEEDSQSLTASEKVLYQGYLRSQNNVETWLTRQSVFAPVPEERASASFGLWHFGRMTAYKSPEDAEYTLQVRYKDPFTRVEEIITVDPESPYVAPIFEIPEQNLREDQQAIFQATRTDPRGRAISACLGMDKRHDVKPFGIKVAIQFDWCLVLHRPTQILTQLYIIGWWKRGKMHFSSHRTSEKAAARAGTRWSYTLDAPLDADSWKDVEEEVRVAFRPSHPSTHIFRLPDVIDVRE